MKTVYLFLVIMIAALVSPGCSITSKRLFTAKVPEPISKPAPQTERERQAADLIAREIRTPVVLKPVAVALSQSMGAPEKPLPSSTPEELASSASSSTTDLQASIVAMQKQIVALNRNLIKYQGKEIEGTGFSILGPGMATIVIGLIALGVIFPPVFTVLAFMYRRLKATAATVVDQIEVAANAPETKEAVAKIKSNLSSAMDAAHKRVVLDLKK